MSRHAFLNIVDNFDEILALSESKDAEAILDSKGVSLNNWVSYGVVGWDESLNTYFVIVENGEDAAPWAIGLEPDELPTYESLCAVINDAFSDDDIKIVLKEEDILIG